MKISYSDLEDGPSLSEALKKVWGVLLCDNDNHIMNNPVIHAHDWKAISEKTSTEKTCTDRDFWRRMDGWMDRWMLIWLSYLRTGTVTSSLFFMYQFYLKQKWWFKPAVPKPFYAVAPQIARASWPQVYVYKVYVFSYLYLPFNNCGIGQSTNMLMIMAIVLYDCKAILTINCLIFSYLANSWVLLQQWIINSD